MILRRPLPIANRTGEKERNFWLYYTPAIRPVAVRAYGPFMRRWGYGFPPEWDVSSVSFVSEMKFRSMDALARAAARYFGIGPNSQNRPVGLARDVMRRVWS
jgi:hypothetical protein